MLRMFRNSLQAPLKMLAKGAPRGASVPIHVSSSVLRDLVFVTHSITRGSKNMNLVVPWSTFSVVYSLYLLYLCRYAEHKLRGA